MNSIFLRLLLVIAVFVGILWFIGSMLPRDYSLEATAVIACQPEEVFPKLNNLSEWQDWSPWSSENLEVKFPGETTGVGAIQTWTDPRGNGKLWITESQPHSLIKYKMYSGGFPELESQFDIKAISEKQTQVKWSSKGRLPSGAFYGFFSMLFEPGMQAEYDRGLTKLKADLESK